VLSERLAKLELLAQASVPTPANACSAVVESGHVAGDAQLVLLSEIDAAGVWPRDPADAV
jgi:hypothetical protein